MALEVAAIVAGLTGGYKLWSLVQDEVDLQAEEDNQEDELTATDASSSRPKKPKRNVEATVTVMVMMAETACSLRVPARSAHREIDPRNAE